MRSRLTMVAALALALLGFVCGPPKYPRIKNATLSPLSVVFKFENSPEHQVVLEAGAEIEAPVAGAQVEYIRVYDREILRYEKIHESMEQLIERVSHKDRVVIELLEDDLAVRDRPAGTRR